MPVRLPQVGPGCPRRRRRGRGGWCRWRWRSGPSTPPGGGTAAALGLGGGRGGGGPGPGARLGQSARPSAPVAAPGAPGRGRRGVAVGFLVAQSAFGVVAGVSFWSLSSTYFAPTPAVAALQRAVGSVGRGDGAVPTPALHLPLRHRVRHPAQCQHRLRRPRVRRVRAGPPHRRTSRRGRRSADSSSHPACAGWASSVPRSPRPPRRASTGSATCSPRPAAPARRARCGPAPWAGEALFHVPGSAAGDACRRSRAPGRTLPVDAPGRTGAGDPPRRGVAAHVVTDAAGAAAAAAAGHGPAGLARHHRRSVPRLSSTGPTGAMLEARVPAGHHVIEVQLLARALQRRPGGGWRRPGGHGGRGRDHASIVVADGNPRPGCEPGSAVAKAGARSQPQEPGGRFSDVDEVQDEPMSTRMMPSRARNCPIRPKPVKASTPAVWTGPSWAA